MSDYAKGVAIVAFGALLYAPDSLMLRLMDMDQWPTTFWRGLLGGGIVLAAQLAWMGPRGWLRAAAAPGWLGPVFAVVFAATTFLFVAAVDGTTVANTLFLVSTSPVFSALIGWAWLGERPDGRTWRTIALALIGVGIIAAGHRLTGEARAGGLIGDAAALGVAVLLALTFNLARAVRPATMVPMIGVGGLLTAAVSAVFAAGALAPPDPSSWPPLLAMGCVIFPLATFCLTIGPRYIPAAEVSLLMLIEAIMAPLLAWWALSEHPGAPTLIGGGVILAALVWSSAERLGGPRKAVKQG